MPPKRAGATEWAEAPEGGHLAGPNLVRRASSSRTLSRMTQPKLREIMLFIGKPKGRSMMISNKLSLYTLRVSCQSLQTGWGRARTPFSATPPMAIHWHASLRCFIKAGEGPE